MVEIKNLSHRFGPRLILDNINLNVPVGRIATIMGSSGGGKTTLLKCVSRLLTPTEGEITVDGVNAIEEPDVARRKMGMVFQSAALFDSMSVSENVLFGVRRHKTEKEKSEKDLVAEVLEDVGLTPDAGKLLPSELSGGMRKRVGIARAIALRPKVMLYDEPTTGLDPVTTYVIDELMVRLARTQGITTLIVSHDVSSVLRVSDQIAFLTGGKLVFDGTPAEFETSTHPEIQEIIQKSRATEFVLSH